MSKIVTPQPNHKLSHKATLPSKIANTPQTHTDALLQRAELAPEALRLSDVQALQHTLGNDVVARVMRPILQAKMRLGAANDSYEREADQTAAKVMQHINSGAVSQRNADEEELLQAKRVEPSVQRIEDEEELLQAKRVEPSVQRIEDEEELLQAKPLAEGIQRVEEEGSLQMKSQAKLAQMHGPEGGTVEQTVEQQIQRAKGGGRPIESAARAQLEGGFGTSFEHVRIHTGSQADTLNRSLNARAFTTGNDIFFRSGEYNPTSSSGKELLAHELTHTIQQGATADTLVQAKFVPLSEERILHIQAKAQERGENLDAEYLQGLVERSADQEQNQDDPQLFIQIGRVLHSVAKRDSSLALKRGRQPLFADVDAVSEANDITEEAKYQNYILRGVLLYTEDEGGPITIDDMHNFMQSQPTLYPKGTVESTYNYLFGQVATGGEPASDNGGGYGSIEFRFKASRGTVYVDNAQTLASMTQAYPSLNVQGVSPAQLARWKACYRLANLPYPVERIGADYLYIETSLTDKFDSAIMFPPGGPVDQSARQASAQPDAPPRQAPPIQTPKRRVKTYTFGATRGSRGAGQKAAMHNYSARDYVGLFNAQAAADKSWEWLHLQGARLGGPNRPFNLVAGTAEANSQMIPYERAIYKLSKLSRKDHPVQVEWAASVQQDAANRNTHIGREIGIRVNFPQGAPPESETESPEQLAALFPITFNALEGASFTKFDRDQVESRSAKEVENEAMDI